MKIKTAIFATLLLTGCDLKELGIDIPKPPEDLERQTVKIHVIGANGVGAEDKPCLSLQVDVNVKGKTPFTFSSPTILEGQEWSKLISKEETLGNTAVDVKVTCAVLDNNADGYSVTTHTLKKSDDTLVIKVSGPEGSAPNLTARTEYKTPVPRVSPPDALK